MQKNKPKNIDALKPSPNTCDQSLASISPLKPSYSHLYGDFLLF